MGNTWGSLNEEEREKIILVKKKKVSFAPKPQLRQSSARDKHGEAIKKTAKIVQWEYTNFNHGEFFNKDLMEMKLLKGEDIPDEYLERLLTKVKRNDSMSILEIAKEIRDWVLTKIRKLASGVVSKVPFGHTYTMQRNFIPNILQPLVSRLNKFVQDKENLRPSEKSVATTHGKSTLMFWVLTDGTAHIHSYFRV